VVSCSGTPPHLARRRGRSPGIKPATFLSPDIPLLPLELEMMKRKDEAGISRAKKEKSERDGEENSNMSLQTRGIGPDGSSPSRC